MEELQLSAPVKSVIIRGFVRMCHGARDSKGKYGFATGRQLVPRNFDRGRAVVVWALDTAARASAMTETSRQIRLA